MSRRLEGTEPLDSLDGDETDGWMAARSRTLRLSDPRFREDRWYWRMSWTVLLLGGLCLLVGGVLLVGGLGLLSFEEGMKEPWAPDLRLAITGAVLFFAGLLFGVSGKVFMRVYEDWRTRDHWAVEDWHNGNPSSRERALLGRELLPELAELENCPQCGSKRTTRYWPDFRCKACGCVWSAPVNMGHISADEYRKEISGFAPTRTGEEPSPKKSTDPPDDEDVEWPRTDELVKSLRWSVEDSRSQGVPPTPGVLALLESLERTRQVTCDGTEQPAAAAAGDELPAEEPIAEGPAEDPAEDPDAVEATLAELSKIIAELDKRPNPPAAGDKPPAPPEP
jgi:hypothetical protein